MKKSRFTDSQIMDTLKRAEPCNRSVRYEWLSQYHWASLAEVQDHATAWMWS
jgi:hypothetical protein